MRKFCLPVIAVFVFVSCSTSKSITSRDATAPQDDGQITITFVQINDVYEIAPLEGGKVGGIARVASLKKQELQKNPNTIMVMAGDFVSPSVYNSLRYEGKAVRGRQMVESLNAAGLDIAVFGNHEFDIKEKELQDRINESDFKWVSSNTFPKTADGIQPFIKTKAGQSEALPETYIISVRDADGTEAKVGFFGLTLPFNKADYVSYTDPLDAAAAMYNRLKDSCDAVVAITHLAVEEDSILATRLPGLALIMGGHEHDMQFKKVNDIFITKAHANAKSAYVNQLTINKKNQTVSVLPALVLLDEGYPLDAATDKVVSSWMQIGFDNFSALGFDAEKVVLNAGAPLDGRETEIRTGKTNLTKMIVKALEQAAPQADIVIYNSGAIRVDDILHPPVTQYDIIRSMPYGGTLLETDMTGKLLSAILESGKNNRGNGGFLQYSDNAVSLNGRWMLDGKVIEPEKIYRVAISDFLLTGGEANMGYLTKEHPGIRTLYPAATDISDSRSDLRLALIRYLERQNH